MAGGTQDWFYHAPSKRNDTGPRDYPAASQIPSLGGGIPYDEWDADERDPNNGMKRGWLRDTDSKYVQLCKTGGRKDLLQMRENKPNTGAPRDYPKPDWFYQEAEEPSPGRAPHKSYLPDYMVYEEYNPEDHIDENKPQSRKKPPFSLDDGLTAFERHGDAVTDKMNMKIPNDESKLRKPPKTKTDPKDYRRRKAADPNAKSPNKSRYAQVPAMTYKEPVNFGKLLSMGYKQEWFDHRDTHVPKQDASGAEPLLGSANQRDRMSTEYREAINKNKNPSMGAGAAHPRNGPSKEVRGTKKSEQMKSLHMDSEEDRKLFKLSKFDKVGPKITSRWSETHERTSPVILADQQIAVPPVSTK